MTIIHALYIGMVAGMVILPVLPALSMMSPSSGEEWEEAYIIGRFLYSDPPKPDQIFKIQFRVINGTIDKFNAANGITARVDASDNGLLEVKYPRNHPYTNYYENDRPTGDINGFIVSEIDDPPYTIHSDAFGKYCIQSCPVEEFLKATTDCFFVFSIPIKGKSAIGLGSTFLLWTMPFHGDDIPESCMSQTLIENVPARPDGTITPLHQWKAGVAAEDAMCPQTQQGEEKFMLLISPKSKPYCAHLSNEGFLKAKGWTVAG